MSLAPLFPLLASLAIAADPVSITIEKDGKILLDGKASNVPAIEKLITEREEANSPVPAVQFDFAIGADYNPVRQLITICVKHKVPLTRLVVTGVDASKAPAGDTSEVAKVELRRNDHDKTNEVYIDGEYAAYLSGLAPAMASEVDPVRTALLKRTEKNPALPVDLTIVGDPGKGLATLVSAIVRAGVRSIRFAYQESPSKK
jgi:hypothetical protein